MLLVRLLFCLFAEDSAIFERPQFRDYLEARTREYCWIGYGQNLSGFGAMPGACWSFSGNWRRCEATACWFSARCCLLEFQRQLATVRVLDPACGCGNFLVVAYRELRLLELVVYNNFSWPEPTDAHHQAIETAAQAVLDTRARFSTATLADLYDPLTMPPKLLKAHRALDRAVDMAYGKTAFITEAERVAFLFERHQQLTSLLPAEGVRLTKKRKPPR